VIFGIALLLAAVPGMVEAQDVAPITAAQISLLGDLAEGAAGHDQVFTSEAVKFLGLPSSTGRQVSANEDNSHIHFFNKFASDPGMFVLLYQDGPVLHAYSIDGSFHFLRGYVRNNNQDVVTSPSDGTAGVKVELKWWSDAASTVIQEANKALGAGKSREDVAKSYGISVETLNKWLAGAN
jgi:hypothetical protein